jgi:hypothetical protein
MRIATPGCIAILVALSISPAGSAEPPTLNPEVVAESSRKSAGDAWVSTRSKAGQFEVQLPFKANVRTFDEADPTKDLQHGYMFGGAVEPEIRFFATRWVYRGGRAMAERYLDRIVGSTCDECSVSKRTPAVSGRYRGAETELIGPRFARFTLAVVVESDLVTLIVVATPSRADDARLQAKQFFRSLKIEARRTAT